MPRSMRPCISSGLPWHDVCMSSQHKDLCCRLSQPFPPVLVSGCTPTYCLHSSPGAPSPQGPGPRLWPCPQQAGIARSMRPHAAAGPARGSGQRHNWPRPTPVCAVCSHATLVRVLLQLNAWAHMQARPQQDGHGPALCMSIRALSSCMAMLFSPHHTPSPASRP